MTDAPSLRRVARDLADAYNTLDELKDHQRRREKLRPMIPHFGPTDPHTDGGWAFNLEYELWRETTDEHIPGGLRTIGVDALTYTTARRAYLSEARPSMLCAYIYRHADEIVQHFPAVDDLADLMVEQYVHITRAIKKRHGIGEQIEQRQTSRSICYRMGQIGFPITPEILRQWARYNHISAQPRPDGRNSYLLSEVVAYAATLDTDGPKD